MNKLYELINCRENRSNECDHVASKECPMKCDYAKFMTGQYVPKEVGFNLEEVLK